MKEKLSGIDVELGISNCGGEIKDVLLHFGIISDESEEKRQRLDERLILHMFHNIEKHLDDFDFAKVFAILEETKKYQIPQPYDDMLVQMEKLMDDLSVDEVRELMKKAQKD